MVFFNKVWKVQTGLPGQIFGFSSSNFHILQKFKEIVKMFKTTSEFALKWPSSRFWPKFRPNRQFPVHLLYPCFSRPVSPGSDFVLHLKILVNGFSCIWYKHGNRREFYLNFDLFLTSFFNFLSLNHLMPFNNFYWKLTSSIFHIKFGTSNGGPAQLLLGFWPYFGVLTRMSFWQSSFNFLIHFLFNFP